MLDIIAAAALAATQTQGNTPFTPFDETIPGWPVVRRPDGCFTFNEGSATSLNIFYNTNRAEDEITLIFSNGSWRLREENVSGYKITLDGADGTWSNLAASTFQDEGDGETVGVIAIAFSRDAVGPMLRDLRNASTLTLSLNDRPLGSIALANSPRAVQRLLDCAATTSSRPVATLPAR